jgi:hypothetical protein
LGKPPVIVRLGTGFEMFQRNGHRSQHGRQRRRIGSVTGQQRLRSINEPFICVPLRENC